VNAVEGDLLDARRDVVQAVIEKKAPGVDSRRSRISPPVGGSPTASSRLEITETKEL